MSILNFQGYTVKQMEYLSNENFNKNQQSVTLEPRLQSDIKIEGTNIEITLSVKVGSVEDNLSPFFVSCTVEGIFVYQPSEDDTAMGIDNFAHNNAVAILYPYVRTIITSLTVNSNEFPAYIMPTINISELLQMEQNK
ncbi:protein-export chaperone SecB [Periweissella ghanensis]|uniref:Protein-export protein SecB n=1 Tax=Periweissella ghanensis TaxID=467997 RepID=A0ABN8BQI2_9LACO|nr:protein-export chaperone SecB [Periweissella ghanensis]MCM0601917.1 protein-export chaperone SecB [Periweissella ghanensis]CAH0418891.1 Protein-export protein SecB [Periweissella ghanensis]